jgi:hypothetical protein
MRLPDRRSYAHLFDFGPTFLRRWKAGALAGLAAGLAGRGMALWRFGASLSRDRSLRIEPLLRFDASVNTLVAASQASDEISVVRNEHFLNWRLFENPRSAYTVWAAHESDALVGYVAVRTKESDDRVKVLVIEDFLVQASGNGAAVLKALLCRVFEGARAQGCERITVIACHLANERVLRRLGFFPYRADAETLSIRARDAALNAAIEAGAPWHLTGANTDRDD